MVGDQSYYLLLRKTLNQLLQVPLHLQQLLLIDSHVHHEQIPHLISLHRLRPSHHERTKTKGHLLRHLILPLDVIYRQRVVCFTDTTSVGLIPYVDPVIRIHVGMTVRAPQWRFKEKRRLMTGEEGIVEGLGYACFGHDVLGIGHGIPDHPD